MKDYKGREFDRFARDAMTVDKDGWYQRVCNCGKEQITFMDSSTYKEKAESTEYNGCSYSQQEINNDQITIIAYASVPYPDINGHDLRMNDRVKYNNGNIYTICGWIESKDESGKRLLVFSENGYWDFLNPDLCTFHSRPTEEEEMTTIKISKSTLEQLRKEGIKIVE
jgi:hypothetical protein